VVHLRNGYKIVWSYFGSKHGKGVHNGVKAIFKHEIKKEQLNVDGRRPQCTTDVVSCCEKKQIKEHLAYPNAK
jgi:hypothetical protein